MELWNRRFSDRRADPDLEAFNASISRDSFLYREEVDASAAYARALYKASLLTRNEKEEIIRGLEQVGKRIEEGEDLSRFEDIHTAVEILLTEEIGEGGKKLHTGRSRNEQVATDERLYLKRNISLIISAIRKVQEEILRLAEAHFGVIMPGYTHLQQGQCILFSHYILSLFWPLHRAKARFRSALSRVDVLPLGSGSLAGSTASLDRKALAVDLGFREISENSLDAVSDRSFILETLFISSLLCLDISRYCEDFIIFCSREFSFLIIDDSIATSSSLMPQKKNPDFFELLRAGCARIFGEATTLFMTVKGLPMTYNKDLQEDKDPLRRGMETTLQMLRIFHLCLQRIVPDKEKIAAALDPFLLSTDLVDYLTDKGIAFREAHGIVGEIADRCRREGRSLDSLSLDEFRKFNDVFESQVTAVFDYRSSIEKKKTTGSTHPDEVRRQMEKARTLLSRESDG